MALYSILFTINISIMKAVIIDASVMISILFKDEENEYAQSLLEEIINGKQIAVPEIFHAEILNVLIVSRRRGRVDDDDINRTLVFLSGMKILTISELNRQDILRLATKYDLSSYDAIYLSLAKQSKLQLATLDQKLKNASISENVFWEK